MSCRGGGCCQAGGESGSSLIEVLIAVAIMGVAFVVVVGGIGTAIIGTDVQTKQAEGDAALRTEAETLASVAYEPCATPSSYAVGPAVAVTGISYWVPGSPGTPDKFVTACPPTDNGLQLIELTTVPGSSRQAPATLRVVKRRP